MVSRIHLAGSRMVASAVPVAIAVLGAIMGGPSSRIVVNLLVTGIAIAVVLALTASGAGSILAWAVQMAASNLALMATLIARALPVVLLTVLVFFNGYVWLMAAIVSRPGWQSPFSWRSRRRSWPPHHGTGAADAVGGGPARDG